MPDNEIEGKTVAPEEAAHQVAVYMAALAREGYQVYRGDGQFGRTAQVRVLEAENNMSQKDSAKFLKSLENDPIVQKLLPLLALENLSGQFSGSNAIDGDTLCSCDPVNPNPIPNFDNWLSQQARSHFKDLAQSASRDPRILMKRDELDSLLAEGRSYLRTEQYSDRMSDLNYLDQNFSKIHPTIDGQGITKSDLLKYAMDNGNKPNFDLNKVHWIQEKFDELRKYNTSDGSPSFLCLGLCNSNADGITRADIADGKAQLTAKIKDAGEQYGQFARKHGF